jgi:hypothetical protein
MRGGRVPRPSKRTKQTRPYMIVMKNIKFDKSSMQKYAVGAGLCQKSVPPTDRRSVKTRPHQYDRGKINPFQPPNGNLTGQIIPS